jgi:hypothetical protein
MWVCTPLRKRSALCVCDCGLLGGWVSSLLYRMLFSCLLVWKSWWCTWLLCLHKWEWPTLGSVWVAVLCDCVRVSGIFLVWWGMNCYVVCCGLCFLPVCIPLCVVGMCSVLYRNLTVAYLCCGGRFDV